MLNLKTHLTSIDEENETRFIALEKKLGSLDTKIEEKVTQKLEGMKKGIVEDVEQRLKDLIEVKIRDEIKEVDSQKERYLNLMCFNLVESTSESADDRKSFDDRLFKQLCASIGVKDVEIRLLFRVGSKKVGSIRPLKIVLNNKRQRKEILDQVRFIKSKAPPTLQRCVITKDFTPRQRDENKKKRQQKIKMATNVNKTSPMVYDYDEETILVSQETDSVPSQLLLRDYNRQTERASTQCKNRQQLDSTRSSTSTESENANETVCGFLADSSMLIPFGIRVEHGED